MLIYVPGKTLQRSKKQKIVAVPRGRMISSPTRTRQTDGHSFLPPSGREGDREAVEGARGYESNDLPFMRCLPLFSSVGTEMSSLLCAFSFRHPCGAGRWGEATAPCSHPGGSRSDSHRRADMESTPTKSKAKRREEQATPLPRSQVLRRWMRCAILKETAGG